jgi:hypothetical protein
MTCPRGPFLPAPVPQVLVSGAAAGLDAGGCCETAGIKTPFDYPVMAMGYSTIVSILIKDEEYPLSSITVRVFRQQTRWILGEMGENRALITQMA